MTKRKFDVDSGLESHNKSRRDLNTLNSNSTMTAHTTAVQQAQTYLAAAQDLDKDELVCLLVEAQLKLDDRENHAKTSAQKTKVIHRLKKRCEWWADAYETESDAAEEDHRVEVEKLKAKYNELEANYFELCCDNEKLKKEIDKDDDEPRCDFCNRTHDEVMYEDNEEDAWNGDTGCCKKCEDDS